MSAEINTEKLEQQIERLEKVRNLLASEFETDKKGNANLLNNEDWKSDTSKVVDEEFGRFSNAAEAYIAKLDEHIEYLKKTVTDSYIDYEAKQNQLIDENIATN